MKRGEGGFKEFDPTIARGPTEFNQMALYLMRLDRRSDERDRALNEGNLELFYRSTMSIFMNCIPRFKQKGMDKERVKEIKGRLLKIGNKVKSFTVTQGSARSKNSLVIEEELFQFNMDLNDLMFEFGLIFPLKEIKALKEIIEEDF